MRRLFKLLLAGVGMSFGCARPDLISAAQFTREFGDALREAKPASKVSVERDLELTVTPPGESPGIVFLHNAYDLYKQDPKAKADIIRRFVASSVDTVGVIRDGVDRSRIIPVIKDRAWLAETRQALIARGAKELAEHVYEDFSPELVILYAEDSPTNIRYLGPTDLELGGIDRKELRTLACGNLLRLLPKIERHGSNGLYMITAGGDYEASLLLLDSIWTDLKAEVQGEVVVAIPTRDLLLVTGSQFPQGIAKLKELAKNSADKGAYRLTPQLFVHRDGRFILFQE
jgi:uncharacterized protein YtpQ (UPF0354 family)